MAVESKDKVITVETAGSIADAEKKYIDAAVKKVQDKVDELPTDDDLLVPAEAADVASIISKFNVPEE